MDNKASAWWRVHRPTRRRLIQAYAALLYNANLKGFIKGEIYTGFTKNVCVPGFNCYSCPGAVGACPLGALQNALASSGARAPYYVLGILLLFGLTLGRTICGWLCPLGLIQELLHKIPTPKLPKSRYTRAFSWLKYVILAVFVVAVPLAYSAQSFPVPAFCKYICPAGTLEGATALLANPANAEKFSMLGILFTRKFILMVLIFTACVFVYRAFCRFLCPLGAIYGLFARLSVLGVRVEAARCTRCGLCVAKCKMDVRRVGDHECIHCGECIGACPTQAIRLKCGKLTLLANEAKPGEQAGTAQPDAERSSAEKSGAIKAAKVRKTRAAIAWTLALALLAGALWYYNRPTAPIGAATQAPEALADAPSAKPTEALPVGYEVGMRCPDFSVPLYAPMEGDFRFPTGKPTVINFWATWCTPCVGELPYFQQLYDAYGDRIALVAIHSSLVTDDVPAFLGNEGYALPFALDESGSVIQSLGGSTMLPMTVIVDQAGKIVYNKTGSVTYALLESLVQPLLEKQ